MSNMCLVRLLNEERIEGLDRLAQDTFGLPLRTALGKNTVSIAVAVLRWLLCYWLVSVAGLFLLLCADAAARRLIGHGISSKRPENGIWGTLLIWAALPFSIIALSLVAAVWIPYFWLYPERHMTHTDLEGSVEEREALARQRAALSQKSFWHRLTERLGLVD